MKTFSARVLAAALCFACVLLSSRHALCGEDELKSTREIRTVETYVPYDEFLKITGTDPNATVMTLEEYRGLVELATARNGVQKVPALPPIESSLIEASYRGLAGDFSSRFDVQFKLSVAGKEWTRCDLGAIVNLGHVTLDGQPGWVVIEGGRAQLLVKGAGLHVGTLSFALPLTIEDDVQKLSATLLASASGIVRMTVPGRAIPSIATGPLDSLYDAATDSTSFSSAVVRTVPSAPMVPATASIFLSWKRKYDSRKSDVLLQADHHMSYLLNQSSPYFIWQTNVQIGRRKTNELTFIEPPGCRTIRLSGTGVHSWLRDAGSIRVLLDEPTIGDVYILASGLVNPTAGEFVLGAPELKDAVKNTRSLALYEPPNAALAMTSVAGLRELALDEKPSIQRFQLPQWEGRLARQFFIENSDAKAVVRATLWATIFDTRTAAYLNLDEKAVTLRCTIAVQPERGRLFSLNLTVPAQWKLAGIQERGTGRGIAIEQLQEGKEDNWILRLKNSAGIANAFNVDMVFTLRDATWTETAWETHALNFTIPSITGARRTESVLGVAAHASVEVAFGEMPAWHSDFVGTASRLGVSNASLRAGLASESAGGELKLNISHSPPRGEYESVLHVQTMEREVWVRADIRVLAVERARAVDELILELPSDAKDPVSITGKGVREIASGTQSNQRVVRFDQPWREVRMLRVEYRASLTPETEIAIPDIRLLGNFDSRRWIVLQSAGVVSLDVKPGESLQAASLDDTPSFANPIKSGRALFAFTFGPGGKYGSFRTKILATAPVLGNLVRELNLITVVDDSGITRTHADMVLSYSQQYIEVKLPRDAKLLALCVDGESAKPVVGGVAQAIKIPVPPRSNARVEIVYEQDFGALGRFGSIEAVSPEFVDFPVSATTWTICHPARYAFDIVDGNTTPLKQRAARFFASEFWDRLIGGRSSEWTAWRQEQEGAPIQFTAGVSNRNTNQQEQSQQTNTTQALKAIETASAKGPLKDRAVGGLAIPEGASVKTAKLGGTARVVVSYREVTYAGFASRAVFLGAMLGGLWLMLRRSFASALVYAVIGLIVGTLLPLALNWESPMLLIPFCEGLTAFALLLGAAYLSHAIKRRMTRSSSEAVARAACVFVCLLSAAMCDVRAGESTGILIPYPKDGKLPYDANPATTKVYVPKLVYLDLMSRVKPEKKEPVVDAPMTKDSKPSVIPFSLGNADYELSADATTYSIKGTLDVTTYDPKGWSKFPLEFGPSRLVSMKIDGQPAGVSNQDGALFVQLKGAKKYALEFELRGPLNIAAGLASLRAQVIPGGATRVTAVLPANVELDVKALPSGSWITKSADGKTQRCEITLGLARVIALSWRSAEIRGKGEVRISSQSYMQFELGLDGYAVSRVERVTADGVPSDQIEFRVTGNWTIATVSAPGLSEWTTSGEGAEKRLRLWFQKPISNVTIQIGGWAPLGTIEAPAAGLSLANALKQEGFIGLKHGEGRHFAASAFGGLKRASQEELAASVTLASNSQPDRILHYNGTPGDARVLAEAEPSQTTLETQYSGVLREASMTIGARTRYTVLGRGLLRHDVELPANWDVRTVRATSMRDWEIVDVNGKRHLVIHFTGRAKTGDEIRWSAEAPLAVPATGTLRVELPQPRAVADAKTIETVDWLLASDTSLTVSQSAETTMQPVPVERAPRWVNLDPGQEWRLAFRSAKSDTRLGVDVSRQDSSLYATVISFVSPAEEHVQVASRIRYRIERAGRDRFLIKLPIGAIVTGLDAANLRGRDIVPDTTGPLLTVLMQSPVSGEQIVDLAYRLPRAPGKDALAQPPSIEDAGARGVEHYAGLLPSDRGSVVLASSTRLHPVKNAEELPFLPANMSQKALSDVFSAEPGWTMTLRETALKMEAGAAAEVVKAEIVTIIAADGGVRSEAKYRVRNHSLQFLEIAMPPDSTLWAVTIGGLSASVSHRGANGVDVLSIPLPRMTETDLPARISIVFESGRAPLPTLYASHTPLAPRVLDVPVVETHWRLYVPDDYDVYRSGGNLKEVVASILDGSRVSSNIKEIERLAKIADVPEQRPAIRKRALQNIALEQQELNDNVTALGAVENTAGREQAKNISREELQSQVLFNSSNLIVGSNLQLRLNEEKRKKELSAANSGNLDPEQVREYLDHFNFLNIRWRAGALSKRESAPAAPSPQDMRVEDLRYLLRFPGYKAGELPAFAPASAPELEKALASLSSLLERDADRTAMDSSIGGFQADERRVGELRMIQLNFRGVEVHPELTLTFRSKSRTTHAIALGALIVLGIAGVLLLKAKRKAA